MVTATSKGLHPQFIYLYYQFNIHVFAMHVSVYTREVRCGIGVGCVCVGGWGVDSVVVGRLEPAVRGVK